MWLSIPPKVTPPAAKRGKDRGKAKEMVSFRFSLFFCLLLVAVVCRGLLRESRHLVTDYLTVIGDEIKTTEGTV